MDIAETNPDPSRDMDELAGANPPKRTPREGLTEAIAKFTETDAEAIVRLIGNVVELDLKDDAFIRLELLIVRNQDLPLAQWIFERPGVIRTIRMELFWIYGYVKLVGSASETTIRIACSCLNMTIVLMRNSTTVLSMLHDYLLKLVADILTLPYGPKQRRLHQIIERAVGIMYSVAAIGPVGSSRLHQLNIYNSLENVRKHWDRDGRIFHEATFVLQSMEILDHSFLDGLLYDLRPVKNLPPFKPYSYSPAFLPINSNESSSADFCEDGKPAVGSNSTTSIGNVVLSESCYPILAPKIRRSNASGSVIRRPDPLPFAFVVKEICRQNNCEPGEAERILRDVASSPHLSGRHNFTLDPNLQGGPGPGGRSPRLSFKVADESLTASPADLANSWAIFEAAAGLLPSKSNEPLAKVRPETGATPKTKSSMKPAGLRRENRNGSSKHVRSSNSTAGKRTLIKRPRDSLPMTVGNLESETIEHSYAGNFSYFRYQNNKEQDPLGGYGYDDAENMTTYVASKDKKKDEHAR